MTEIKKIRTPRQLESIVKGALQLSLEDRVELCRQLHISIEAEVKAAQEKANQFLTAAQSLNGHPMPKQ